MDGFNYGHIDMPLLAIREYIGFQANIELPQRTASELDLIQNTVLLALIPVVVAFSFIVFVFYRAKREAHFRQKETELKLSLAEGELKALRAQIDPHFIFNCLNSIHHIMFTNDGPKAGDYLIKFSRLIRHVLESSALRSVSLADEIEANRIYIEMEQLRMSHELIYYIHLAKDLDATRLEIPPMMIQPFVENAIWHGLAGGGIIELQFSLAQDRHILCTITDQGKPKVHRHQANNLSGVVKKTSMGMSLMRERFDRINQLHQTQATFNLADRTDGVTGKEVKLIIPIM